MHDFQSAIAKIKVPMLILDQKWHRLFALGCKPENVKELEILQQQVNDDNIYLIENK